MASLVAPGPAGRDAEPAGAGGSAGAVTDFFLHLECTLPVANDMADQSNS